MNVILVWCQMRVDLLLHNSLKLRKVLGSSLVQRVCLTPAASGHIEDVPIHGSTPAPFVSDIALK